MVYRVVCEQCRLKFLFEIKKMLLMLFSSISLPSVCSSAYGFRPNREECAANFTVFEPACAYCKTYDICERLDMTAVFIMMSK